MPSRRGVLAALATTVGAGCSSMPGTGTNTTTRATDELTTTTRSSTTTDPEPTITGLSIQRSYVGVMGGHHMYVRAEPDRQYVLVRTDADRGDWPAFAVTLDGETFDGRGPSLTYREYAEGPNAIPVVTLPLDVAPSEGFVTVGGTTRELDSGTLDRLAHPPAFEVRATDIPETAPRGGSLRVALTVAHRGGRDEAFRTNVTNFTSQPTIVERRLSAGDEVTVSESLSVYGAAGKTHRVAFDWGYGSEEQSVTVEADEGNGSGGSDGG